MYGIGGTVRATANLAAGLVALPEVEDVEIVSVHRKRDLPQIGLDPRVRLVPLIDARRRGWRYRNPLGALPSRMFHDPGPANSPLPPSLLADRRVAAYLRRTRADVVIATRPLLVGHLAAHGRGRGYLRIGQEHRTLDSHNPELRRECLAAAGQLDAYLTVSEADAEQWRAGLPPGSRARVLCVPNSVPAPEVTPSRGDSRTVVAAGRFIPIKRYDRLIDAFARVAAERPGWQLRIYGRGRKEGRLRRRINELGLHDRVRLMGAVSPIETEWAKGAVAAVSSDGESFGLTIVEAMRCGVPVVSTDCPYGPGEIITHGHDGLLVPLEGGSDAFAEALISLIDDPRRRREMGRAGLKSGAAYDPERIAARYTELVRELAARPLPGAAEPGSGERPDSGRRSDGGKRPRRRPWRPRPAAPAPVSAPAGGSDGGPVPARCEIAEDGALTVSFAPDALPAGELDLVLARRGGSPGGRVRLPLPRGTAGDGRRVTAALPRTAGALPEGRWDCLLAPRGSDGSGRPVVAELVQTAALLSLPPAVDGDGVAGWIPYTTADGRLAVRSWLRPAHAEVEEVVTGEESVTVSAVLFRPPGGEAGAGEAVGGEARVTASGTGLRVPVRALPGGRFEFTLGYREALEHRAGGPQVWELALSTEPGARPVPLGRITGDIPDRRRTDRYPAAVLPHPEWGPTRLRPVFTVHNALALAATDVPPS
ncbi:glycosyltransferase family 4 protein [Streptomyces sodiiphilus]|uniref:D-inositol 3-phosphate glycosyltransferase n=2 Tax=Streptomyces sodiiphilus TaxID=226217 RepID=A0ABN2NRT3_9ACTN